MTYVQETRIEYLVFDIDCSFKVDINNLQKVRIKILNKNDNLSVLFDEMIDF